MSTTISNIKDVVWIRNKVESKEDMNKAIIFKLTMTLIVKSFPLSLTFFFTAKIHVLKHQPFVILYDLFFIYFKKNLR